jgi:quinol monooxygenase YgiN
VIVLHATFPIDPEKREKALALVEDLVEASQTEEGTIEYRATTDVSEPNVIRIFEQYEDEAAYEAHAESDHLGAFKEALPDLLGGQPEVIKFEVESATTLDV